MPKVTPNEFATKEDLNRVTSEIIEFVGDSLIALKEEVITKVGSDITGLRQELKGDITGLRQELKGDITGLRQELKGDITGLRQELKEDINRLDDRFDELTAEIRVLTNEVSSVLKNHEKRIARLEPAESPPPSFL